MGSLTKAVVFGVVAMILGAVLPAALVRAGNSRGRAGTVRRRPPLDPGRGRRLPDAARSTGTESSAHARDLCSARPRAVLVRARDPLGGYVFVAGGIVPTNQSRLHADDRAGATARLRQSLVASRCIREVSPKRGVVPPRGGGIGGSLDRWELILCSLRNTSHTSRPERFLSAQRLTGMSRNASGATDSSSSSRSKPAENVRNRAARPDARHGTLVAERIPGSQDCGRRTPGPASLRSPTRCPNLPTARSVRSSVECTSAGAEMPSRSSATRSSR